MESIRLDSRKKWSIYFKPFLQMERKDKHSDEWFKPLESGSEWRRWRNDWATFFYSCKSSNKKRSDLLVKLGFFFITSLHITHFMYSNEHDTDLISKSIKPVPQTNSRAKLLTVQLSKETRWADDLLCRTNRRAKQWNRYLDPIAHEAGSFMGTEDLKHLDSVWVFGNETGSENNYLLIVKL